MKPIKIIQKLNEEDVSSLEKVQDETDWKALKDGLNMCSSHEDIFNLMKKTMSNDTYIRYASRFSRRQKSNSYVMYWPYSFNKMKEVLEKEADKNKEEENETY